MAQGLIIHARIAPCTAHGASLIDDGFVSWRDDRVTALGPMSALTRLSAGEHDGEGVAEIDAAGALVTPGLIDCHTHLVHAGNRAREFEMRLESLSYEQIARAGGGIVATVGATRLASESELVAQSQGRLQELIADGVTSVEIKSGYGLELATEQRMLRAARRLGNELNVGVRTSFLGAHALPAEFAGRPDAYIDLVCSQMLPAIAAEGLADAVDAFCEGIGFSPAQTRRVFGAARALGLPVKLHADQLSDLGGAALAAEFGALSADHLEYASEASLAAMAAAGTVAVLLPGAFYFLRETRLPPIDALRRHGVPIAIATDCNPGSSPCTSLVLMLNMACTLFRLTPAEALAGVTRHAAQALGLGATHGSLAPGMQADIAIWDVESAAELSHAFGARRLRQRIRAGQPG